MEAVILEDLQRNYPTIEEQQARLTELVDGFGNLDANEIKDTTADILCLAKLLYESGQEEIMFDLEEQLVALRRQYRKDESRFNKLVDLTKCLTGFKPSISRNIQRYFSEPYGVDSELITCLPKISGQQTGAEVEVKRSLDDTNPAHFYVKTHQEFCSKSHPTFLVMTSDGTGEVNFKELFMYKVLEYIGYGPQSHFIIDYDVARSRVEEGILIATRDLGYTETPETETKSFEIFKDIREELESTPLEDIDEITKRDIIAIDMISRAFLLEDVMINQGNFGRTVSQVADATKSSWDIIDFVAPIPRDDYDDYSYGNHYPGGIEIFHSFKVGNASHSYNRSGLERVKDILSQRHARDYWLLAMDRLSLGDEKDMPVHDALAKAYDYVVAFMEENREILHAKPDRMERRTLDLRSYCEKITENFDNLERSLRTFLSEALEPTSTPLPSLRFL